MEEVWKAFADTKLWSYAGYLKRAAFMRSNQTIGNLADLVGRLCTLALVSMIC